MAAAKVDLFVERARTYVKPLVYRQKNGPGYDISNFTPKLVIKPDYDSPDEDIILTLGVLVNGTGISLGSAGEITIRIGADRTGTLVVPPDGGRLGVYDFAIKNNTDASDVRGLMRGSVWLSPTSAVF
jgi:hypothetical protein